MYNFKMVVLMFSLFLLFSCASPIYETSFSISKSITEEQRQEAASRTATELGWVVNFPKKGVYRVNMHKKTHKATFDLICKKTTCSTKYVHSSNLKYNSAKHTIHSNYNKWVQTFVSHFTDKLRMYQ